MAVIGTFKNLLNGIREGNTIAGFDDDITPVIDRPAGELFASLAGLVGHTAPTPRGLASDDADPAPEPIADTLQDVFKEPAEGGYNQAITEEDTAAGVARLPSSNGGSSE